MTEGSKDEPRHSPSNEMVYCQHHLEIKRTFWKTEDTSGVRLSDRHASEMSTSPADVASNIQTWGIKRNC